MRVFRTYTKLRGRLLDTFVLTGTLLVLLGFAWTPKAQAVTTHSFTAWVGDKKIGSHTVTIRETEDALQVDTRVKFDMKVLFVKVLDYEHTAQETWRGECLERLSSTTVSNGKRSSLEGAADIPGFSLTVSGGNTSESLTIPSCVRSFAYWDLTRLSDQLVNTQTGEISEAALTFVGTSAIPRVGVAAEQHLLKTNAADISLWYTPEGKWLALQTEARGRDLVYVNDTLL